MFIQPILWEGILYCFSAKPANLTRVILMRVAFLSAPVTQEGATVRVKS